MTRVAADLEVGQAGRVVRVVGADEISSRILEMGVTPGVVIRRRGRVISVLALEFADDRISAIHGVGNPEKLKHVR